MCQQTFQRKTYFSLRNSAEKRGWKKNTTYKSEEYDCISFTLLTKSIFKTSRISLILQVTSPFAPRSWARWFQNFTEVFQEVYEKLAKSIDKNFIAWRVCHWILFLNSLLRFSHFIYELRLEKRLLIFTSSRVFLLFDTIFTYCYYYFRLLYIFVHGYNARVSPKTRWTVKDTNVESKKRSKQQQKKTKCSEDGGSSSNRNKV